MAIIGAYSPMITLFVRLVGWFRGELSCGTKEIVKKLKNVLAKA